MTQVDYPHVFWTVSPHHLRRLQWWVRGAGRFHDGPYATRAEADAQAKILYELQGVTGDAEEEGNPT